jgi:predicted RNA binding protein YcfA (HicA-like mRNA interferase family)
VAYPQGVWNQLKGLTADDLMRALKRDGWSCDMDGGSMRIFLSADKKRRVSVHYHPHKTYGQKMLLALLDDIGWSEDAMKELKLIK